MKVNHVVTCFLEYQGSILILKRSRQVGSYEEKWAGISGYIETGHSAHDQAVLELYEEAGLQADDVRLVKEGRCIEVVDKVLDCQWIVHPFRFRLLDPGKVTLDWEHTECEWIQPQEIKNRNTVPNLYETWMSVS